MRCYGRKVTGIKVVPLAKAALYRRRQARTFNRHLRNGDGVFLDRTDRSMRLILAWANAGNRLGACVGCLGLNNEPPITPAD